LKGLHINRFEKTAKVFLKQPNLRATFVDLILEYISKVEETLNAKYNWLRDIARN